MLNLAIPQWSARVYATAVDWHVVAFTTAATALTALLFGLAPAWHTSRMNLYAALQQSSRNTAVRSGRRLRSAMVVCEVALAIVLLSGAGLMMRTMGRLHAVEWGFDHRNLLTMQTHLENRNYEVVADRDRDLKRLLPSVEMFYGRLLERVSALPGVEAAALASSTSRGRTLSIPGRPEPPQGRQAVFFTEVSPSYFRTMRIPLRLGRLFDESDRAGAPWTIVVNESLAKQYFPGENPIGKSLRLRLDPWKVEEDRPRVIVGVVGAVKLWAREGSPPPAVYASSLQQPEIFPGGSGWQHRQRRLVIRTRAGVRTQTAALTSAVKSIVAELDKDIPVTQVQTMESMLREGDEGARAVTTLLAGFGLLAALLSACGIYGVMSYLVAERTREIGLRMALGAQPGDVLRYVVRQAFLLTAVGVVCGLAAAAALTRLIADFLFGVTPLDPVTHVGVVVMLAAVALLASYLPARRAAHVDPMAALRCE